MKEGRREGVQEGERREVKREGRREGRRRGAAQRRGASHCQGDADQGQDQAKDEGAVGPVLENGSKMFIKNCLLALRPQALSTRGWWRRLQLRDALDRAE